MYTVVSIYSQVPLIIISGFASEDVMEKVFFCLFVLELTLDCQVVKCQVGQACSQGVDCYTQQLSCSTLFDSGLEKVCTLFLVLFAAGRIVLAAL